MQLYPTEQGKTCIARIAFPKLHLGRYLLLDIAFNVCLSKTEECPSMVLLPLDFNQNHCILADIWFSMIWCILPGIASNTFLSKTNILNYGFEGMPKCGVTDLCFCPCSLMLHLNRGLVPMDLQQIICCLLSGITSNFHPLFLECDFEGMPKYGVTPLLSPFDIDFDRPLLATA